MSIDPCDWITELSYDQVPVAARREAGLCLLDTLGVAAAATQTRLAGIMAQFVGTQMPGAMSLLFSPGKSSTVGYALHGGALIDSLDAHDGHALTKGHVGAALIPALLAFPEATEIDGRELLTRVVLGYEIATRAGIALHATAPDYHTSGAWNALGVAAAAGRQLGLNRGTLREALGTAEFYGPRSQMMRCIDHPTMVKDGSAWGAHAGVSAALLAASGFTGAPALTVTAPEAATIWSDLGTHWLIEQQYRKPYPVCRWAQPAVEAVLTLRGQLPKNAHEVVTEIEIFTFHEAKRLATPAPDNTEQAQYSLPWAVACAITGGGIAARDVSDSALQDGVRTALAYRVAVHETAECNQRFPAERWARVRLHLRDGRILDSNPCQARGDIGQPLDEAELGEKFHALADPVLGTARSQSLRTALGALESGQPLARLLLTDAPPDPVGAPPACRAGT